MRAAIVRRSEEHVVAEPAPAEERANTRSRRGQRKSKPNQNVEGLTEAQLRHQTLLDKGVCCKFKKRHRKDLTYEEITSILSAAKEPHKLQKDVA